MTVTARFFVQRVDPTDGGGAFDIGLSAVCRGAHNRVWSSYTPSGNITMRVRNGAAAEQFVVGQEVEVTFRPAPAPPCPGDGHAPEPVCALPPPNPQDGPRYCGICGVYPAVDADGNEDWSKHDELYAAPAE